MADKTQTTISYEDLQRNVADRNRRILELEKTLKACAKQFRFYQANHQLKTPPDVKKAAVNQEYAEMCEEVLNAKA